MSRRMRRDLPRASRTNPRRCRNCSGDGWARDIFCNSISLERRSTATPAVLAESCAHGVGRGWTFLTSARPRGYRAPAESRWASSTPDPDLDKDKENHIGNIRYGNEPLMLVGRRCPGMADAKRIVESICAIDRAVRTDFPISWAQRD